MAQASCQHRSKQTSIYSLTNTFKHHNQQCNASVHKLSGTHRMAHKTRPLATVRQKITCHYILLQ